MNQNQELLRYYCGQIQSEWAQKKALAYLRILAEAEGGVTGTDTKGKKIQADKQQALNRSRKIKYLQRGEQKTDR